MLRCLGLMALALAVPGSAMALPPPPPVAVVLVHAGGPPEDSEQLLEAISDGSLFEAVAAPVGAEAFEACGAEPDREACVRGVLAGVDRSGAPIVVVMTLPSPGFYGGWQCIGEGSGPTRAERQRIGFDPSRWDNATARYWEDDRQAAASCILAAASESGW